MATTTRRTSETLRERLLFVAAIAIGVALVCYLALQVRSYIGDRQQEAAAYDEFERLSHIDQTDPATLTPHQGLPYVIADDDLCRIEITGVVYMVDEEDYHGYGHTLSQAGYKFELTVVNKSQHLTIGAGIWEEPWVAAGENSRGELLEGAPVSYHGFLDKIAPGESTSGSFSLFSKEHNFLYAVSSFYGTFEICDERNRTIATYPFSYVEEPGTLVES
jgi:hypothetical protein